MSQPIVTGIRKRLYSLMLLAGLLLLSIVPSPIAEAQASLRILPLTYHESLQRGEIKKGHVDVINPSDKKLNLVTEVQAFRQIDDKGSLEFFYSEQVEAAITPDYDKFELGAGQAMRLYFEVDGSKLSTGDVFAAIFVKSTSSSTDDKFDQAVRVGTLLMLENGTPGSRQASVTYLEAPFWQSNSNLRGSYRIKNTAKTGEATGFSPKVKISLTPFGGDYGYQSSLVFAGRERGNEFSFDTNRAGLYYLEVSHGDSSQGRWVLLLPWWAMLVVGGLLVVLVVAWYYRTRSRKIYKKS